jgi:predicted DNA binding protein
MYKSSADNLLGMTLFEVVLKLGHDDFFTLISKRFPTVKIFIWCNLEHDVYEIVCDDPELLSLVKEQLSYFPIVEQSTVVGGGAHIIVKECTCMNQNTVAKFIGSLNILQVFPSILSKGWQYRRFIAFKHEDLEEFLGRLEKGGWTYDILRKVPFNGFLASSLTLTADSLFSNLTEKQIEALLTAHRHGYYTFPRKADAQTIAAKVKVPRTTFQDHLKKAENKLVVSLVPYIQLFRHASTESRASLRIM